MTDSNTPSTMRSWQYSTVKGGLEKSMKLNSSARVPKTSKNQHLVEITATALNPIDYKPVENVPGVFMFAVTKPATPGIDYCGTIVRPAEGYALKPGQTVFGVSGASPLAGGALAEFNVADVRGTVALPDNVDLIDAATVGVAGLTAYQSIVPHVKKGDKVFINGGSGGTGIFGIQIAKAVECHVTTSCSTSNMELCQNLGADRIIDYKKESVLEALKASGHKFDHVVDNVGSNRELLWRCHEFMQPESRYVTVGVEPSIGNLVDSLKRKIWPGFLGGQKGKVVGFWPHPNPEDYAQIGEWMSSGKVKAVVDQKFAFEDAPKALEKLKTGRAKGKIVIEVASGKGTSVD